MRNPRLVKLVQEQILNAKRSPQRSRESSGEKSSIDAFYKKFPAESFENYKAAKAAADRLGHKAYRALILEKPPLPLDEEVVGTDALAVKRIQEAVVAFFDENGAWLKACRNRIQAAVDSGDERFILSLAQLIKRRPFYRKRSLLANWLLLAQDDDPEPKRITQELHLVVAGMWIRDGLWLMPDPIAAAYVSKFSRFTVTPASFTKIRQRTKLVQNADHPIIGFTTTGGLILKPGWTNTNS